MYDKQFRERMRVVRALAHGQGSKLPNDFHAVFDFPDAIQSLHQTVLPELEKTGKIGLPPVTVDDVSEGVSFIEGGFWTAIQVRPNGGGTEGLEYRYPNLVRLGSVVFFPVDVAIMDAFTSGLMIIMDGGSNWIVNDPANRPLAMRALILRHYLETAPDKLFGGWFRKNKEDLSSLTYDPELFVDRFSNIFSTRMWQACIEEAYAMNNSIRAYWQLRDAATLVGFYGEKDTKLKMLDRQQAIIYPSKHIEIVGPTGDAPDEAPKVIASINPIYPVELTRAALDWTFLGPLHDEPEQPNSASKADSGL